MAIVKKHLLLVGDANHQFITNFAQWLKKEMSNSFIIDILSYTPIQKEFQNYYNSIYQIKEHSFIYRIISKIKGVRIYFRFYLFKKLLKSLPNYEVIHFHYINVYSYFLVDWFKRNTSSKIIFSVWGSDMYRVRLANEKRFLHACLKADVLTFTNQKTIEHFKIKYKWMKNNIFLYRYGLAPLDKLIELSSSKDACKKQLNWNNKKIAVTIGYNMSPEQQHIKILNQFNDANLKRYQDRILLIIPITYGGSTIYKNQLLKKLKLLPFEYMVYDTFLIDEQVAQIRKASDIMIQLQITDQFSGSMQEHLYAHNVVITGSWLPYETLKKQGAWFIEIVKIEELIRIIPDVINNFEEFEKKTINNPKVIFKSCLWRKNIRDWVALYKN